MTMSSRLAALIVILIALAGQAPRASAAVILCDEDNWDWDHCVSEGYRDHITKPPRLLIGAATGATVALPLALLLFMRSARRHHASLFIVSAPLRVGVLYFTMLDYADRFVGDFARSAPGPSPAFHQACMIILVASTVLEFLVLLVRR